MADILGDRIETWFVGFWRQREFYPKYPKITTLQGTNISPKHCILKMIFLFPRWDVSTPWRVSSAFLIMHVFKVTEASLMQMRHWILLAKTTPKWFWIGSPVEMQIGCLVNNREWLQVWMSNFKYSVFMIPIGLISLHGLTGQVLDGFHISSPNLEHCHPNWTAVTAVSQ